MEDTTYINIVHKLGGGREEQTDEGYRTPCPCCDDNTNLNLQIWLTPNCKLRCKCHNDCNDKVVWGWLHKNNVLPRRYVPNKTATKNPANITKLTATSNKAPVTATTERNISIAKASVPATDTERPAPTTRTEKAVSNIDTSPVANKEDTATTKVPATPTVTPAANKTPTTVTASTTVITEATSPQHSNKDNWPPGGVTIRDCTLKFIANKLGGGREEKTDEGYRTPCPCCGDDNTELNLRVWMTESEMMRYRCNNGCKTGDVTKWVKKNMLKPNDEPTQDATPKAVSTEKPTNYYMDETPDDKQLINGLIMPSTQFLQENVTPPVSYISPVLKERSLTMVYAKAGVGKSWFVHSIAVALTRKDFEGKRVGPWPVEKPCGVMLIDGELPASDLRQRMMLLEKVYGPASEKRPLNIITAEMAALKFRSSINLGEEGIRSAITDALLSNDIKVLMLDNLSSLTQGVPENSKKAYDPINSWFLELRRKGISVILVHHAGKDGKDRGHSGRLDNLDSVLVLDRDKNDPVDTVKFTVKFEKSRGLKPGEGRPITLQLTGDDDKGLRLVTEGEGCVRDGKNKENKPPVTDSNICDHPTDTGNRAYIVQYSHSVKRKHNNNVGGTSYKKFPSIYQDVTVVIGRDNLTDKEAAKIIHKHLMETKFHEQGVNDRDVKVSVDSEWLEENLNVGIKSSFEIEKERKENEKQTAE